MGDTVAERRKRSDDEVIEFYACGVPCHNRSAERVNHTLDDDITHGNKTLLEDARDGDNGGIFEYTPRKVLDFAFGFDFS